MTHLNHLQKSPGWLLSTVLIIGACILPLSVACGQDFKAVERRLGRAVEAGEITLEQAKVMLGTLRRGTGRQSRDQRALRERYAEGKRKIEAAAKAGKISREDAAKKILEMRESMFGNRREESRERDRDEGSREQDRDQRALRERYAEGERKIQAAVKAGRISREDAVKRLTAMRESMFGNKREESRDHDRDQGGDQKALRERYAEGERKIKALVKAGKVSREDAEKRLSEMRKRMFGNKREESRERDRDEESREQGRAQKALRRR